MREHKRIKGKIFSPPRLSLSAWIKFLQLPPMAFMDSVCPLRDFSRHTWEGCKDAWDLDGVHAHTQILTYSLSLSLCLYYFLPQF